MRGEYFSNTMEFLILHNYLESQYIGFKNNCKVKGSILYNN